MGEDRGAGEDRFVDMEFGTVGAAFRPELNDEDGRCEITGVWRGFR